MKNKKVLISFISILLLACFMGCKADVETPVENITITYISTQGDDFNEEKIVPAGYKLKKLDLMELSVDGYNFLGWYLKDNKVAVGQEITKDSVLVAKWKKHDETTIPSDVTGCIIFEGENSIEFNWKNPADSNYVGIELVITVGSEQPNIIKLSNKDTQYVLNENDKTKSYYFFIRTYNEKGEYSAGIKRSIIRDSYTNDGLSLVTIGYNKDSSDLESDYLNTLLFVLSGHKSNVNDDSAVQTVDLSDKKTVFTYEEILRGVATKALDPIVWDLTLTAYEKKEDMNNQVDFSKQVFSYEEKNIDLRNGSVKVNFNILPIR